MQTVTRSSSDLPMQSTEQIKEDLNNLVNLGIQIVRGSQGLLWRMPLAWQKYYL